MSDDLYQEMILEELQNLRHRGRLEGEHVHSHHERNASCGDEVTVFLDQSENDSIKQLSWEGEGCAISMATTSLLFDHILSQQLSLQQVLSLSESDLLDLLGLDTISVGRKKCLHLGLKAVQNTLGK